MDCPFFLTAHPLNISLVNPQCCVRLLLVRPPQVPRSGFGDIHEDAVVLATEEQVSLFLQAGLVIVVEIRPTATGSCVFMAVFKV